MMTDVAAPDYIEHAARVQEDHYRGCCTAPADGRYRAPGQRAAAFAVVGGAA